MEAPSSLRVRVPERLTAHDLFELVLPDAILLSELSSEAKILGAYLWTRAEFQADAVVPTSYIDLAKISKRTEARARQCVDELIAAGFCGRIHARRGRGGGLDLRVYGPAKLVERFKLQRRPDSDQISLWPHSAPLAPSASPDPGGGGQIEEITSDSFDLESAAPGLRLAHPRAVNVSSIKETTTSTLTSTLTLGSQIEGTEAPLVDRVRGRCHSISETIAAITAPWPHHLHRKFIVLAALWAEGVSVRVWLGGSRWEQVRLDAASIDGVLRGARSAGREYATRRFYSGLRDQMRQQLGCPEARMPSSIVIRRACDAIGLAWREEWERSPADDAKQALPR